MSTITAKYITEKFIKFHEKSGHIQIENSPLVPRNDPTTLFISAGMQPLVPYLLGKPHPKGDKLVNVQNSFRAQDIEEIGDNRHTTFFRMLGNWSLGAYFKEKQLQWFFTFLTDKNEGLGISASKLYVTIFKGYNDIPYDKEAENIWSSLFKSKKIDPKDHIFSYGVDKNWWSRAGVPEKMPEGEPGGPDSEVFYDFGKELKIHENSVYSQKKCHVNCDCGRYLEIGNSVFMQYQKKENGFIELPQKNVDFGGGLERLLSAASNQPDIFLTNLFAPIVSSIEKTTDSDYKNKKNQIRIITDHLTASMFITANNVKPSNTEQGYVLRRLLRRAFDNFSELDGKNLNPILHKIAEQYSDTDPVLQEKFEKIKLTILEEKEVYENAISRATHFIQKKYKNFPEGKKNGGEIMGTKEISAHDAFVLYSTHGLSPSQIKSLGYSFNSQNFAELMKRHKNISRKGAEKKFKGGLADSSENTLRGHTATHLLHQALRDIFGNNLKQSGSNITGERVRFDFTFDRKLTDEELKKIEEKVNKKIDENLPVYFKILPKKEAEKSGALSFFGEKYGDEVKVYFIGPESEPEKAYSKEFCGGPHVKSTGEIKSFKITKEKSASKGTRRIYAEVG